jgi:4'-phosphopantetheinyl transferase
VKDGFHRCGAEDLSSTAEAAPRRLQADAVTIWYLPSTTFTPELRRGYEDLLDPAERAKAARFLREKDRCQYLAAHALLRRMLAAHDGLVPASWRFREGPHGRPEPEPGQTGLRLRFSLSHTDGMVACALTRERDIGLDVEMLERGLADLDMLAALFAPHEAGLLQRCAAERKRVTFFELWTLKEAYLKALGLGLSAPLDGFAFDLRPPRLRSTDVDPGPPDGWQFRLLRPTPHYQIAVAVRAAADHGLAWEWLEVDAATLLPRTDGTML